jgi:hypothetical protein
MDPRANARGLTDSYFEGGSFMHGWRFILGKAIFWSGV